MQPLALSNAWIASVICGKRRIGGAIALCIAGAVLLCSLAGGPAVYRAWVSADRPETLPAALARAIYYVAVFFPLYATVFAARFWERRQSRQAQFTVWSGFALGIAVGGLGFLAVVGGVALAGGVAETAALQPELSLGIAVGAALTGFQVFGEEVFFRGWLQPILGAEWGARTGLAVTAAIFAGAHLFTDVLGPVAILNVFLGGLVFGLLAFRSGGLAAPFCAHWVWNWLEQSVMGLVPNPGVDSLGSLFDFDLVGSPLLSGGTEGLNGSLAETAALLALAAGLYFIAVPSREESA